MTPEQLNEARAVTMADREELLRLASLCEAASGPDRELDVAILTHPAFGYRDVHGDGRMFDRGNDGYWFLDDCNIHQLPSPTTSLDAAMTLLPVGREWRVRWAMLDDGSMAAIARCGLTSVGVGVNTTAATPALALAAASLRARAQDPLRAHGGDS